MQLLSSVVWIVWGLRLGYFVDLVCLIVGYLELGFVLLVISSSRSVGWVIRYELLHWLCIGVCWCLYLLVVAFLGWWSC